MEFDTTEALLTALAKGEMVILLDDEKRENEGDIIMAAEKVTPQAINFMATHARGLICLAMTEAKCRQLQLPLMVPRDQNTSLHSTNFTISIEAKEGITTGISAADRAQTIKTAVSPNAKPQDLARPGHVFPLMAQKGGVLERAGHTEAAVDLVALAGCEPMAVLVEIMNPDGSMARSKDLLNFAHQHLLKIGTIADLLSLKKHRI